PVHQRFESSLQEQALCAVEIDLGRLDLQETINTAFVTHTDDSQDFACRAFKRTQSVKLIGIRRLASQGIGYFAKCSLNGLLVLCYRNILARLGQIQVTAKSATGENRHSQLG